MQIFNIVDPSRDDFDERAVSAEAPAEERVRLAAQLRAMIELRGTIRPKPFATKTHTSEELAEMGFIGIAMAEYGPGELNYPVYVHPDLPEELNPDGLNYE